MAVESKKLDKLESLYYDLDKKHALLQQDVGNIDKKTDEMQADIKTITQTVTHLSVVTIADFNTYTKGVDDRFKGIEGELKTISDALAEQTRNTSVFVKLKTKLGDRGLDIVTSVIIIVILFVIFATVGKPDALTSLFKG